ncbi:MULTISPECIES: D-glycero-beta-D-manno-heptose 1-phosphate adenylyltransferase [Saccharopolyspora]|uniref:D-glycero-beta-D-manno-heptose 1-phosphate adenylyltransferase n=1 Tax=Saccharopolyspora cebuensis TaxID=418759 RepID=A0ABV4CPQ4_9PSEU
MNLVIIGDALLDADLTGTATRLCPDAPVPVVDLDARRRRPGGAALAALLAAEEGADVTLIAGRGDDAAGRELDRLLAGRVRLVDVPFLGGTPTKTRVRADGRSVVRLDAGDGTAADVPLGEAVQEALRDADAVLVADYGRGVARNTWLRRELSRLPPHVPLVWDPHPRGAEPVARADLVVPNHAEAARLSGATAPDAAATALWRHWECGAVAVTLGARGAVVVPPGAHLPAPEVPAGSDVCGAGDGFAVAVVRALAAGAPIAEAVRAAVEEASRFVAAGGAATWTTEAEQGAGRQPGRSAFDLVRQVRGGGGRVVAAGGCFDLLHPGHVNLLDRARSLGDALVVCLNSDDSVRRLKGSDRPVVRAEDRRRLLEALECVDAVVVFDETSPCELLAELRPDVWVKGGDYEVERLPETRVVESYGGRTVLVPLVAGYSTSRLLSGAAG